MFRQFVAPLALFAGLSGAQAQVDITDGNVEQAIRDEINKPTGDLTEADLARVTVLDMSSMELTTLTLPEGLVNLEELYLSNNALAGTLFAPLKFPGDLANLRILDMSRNNLTGLSFLNGDMSSLEEVTFRDNEIKTLTLPDILSNVTWFEMTDNPMTSLTIPEGFANLEELHIERNELTEVNLPGDLVNLDQLYAERNQIVEITIPEGLVNLRILWLFGNGLEVITLPEGLSKLEELDLFDNNIKHLDMPDGMDVLGKFDLTENPDLETVSISEEMVDAANNVFTLLTRLQEDLEFEFVIRIAPRVITSLVRLEDGSHELTLIGRAGEYQIYYSLDLIEWEESIIVSNEEGEVTFVDDTGTDSRDFPEYPRALYWRALRLDD